MRYVIWSAAALILGSAAGCWGSIVADKPSYSDLSKACEDAKAKLDAAERLEWKLRDHFKRRNGGRSREHWS